MKATVLRFINLHQWMLFLGAVSAGLVISFAVAQVGPLALLAVPLLVVVLVSFGYPELGLFAFLFVTYINLSYIFIYFHGLPSIAKPFVGFLVLVVFVRRFIFRDEFHGWSQLALLLVLYGLLGSLSLLYVSNFDQAYLDLIDFIKDGLIVILIIMIISRRKSLRPLIWVLLAAGILMGSISIFQRVTGTFSNNYWGFATITNNTEFGQRLGGPLRDPNFYSQIILVLVPLAMERFLNEKKPLLKLMAGSAFIIYIFTVIFTYSRGGFIALLAAIFIWLVKRPPKPQGATLIAAAALIVFQLLPANYTDRILSLSSFLPGSGTAVVSDGSFRGRSSENLVAINMFLDHPVTGIGPGNYSVYYQEYSRQLGIDPRRGLRSAHSLYLEVIAERGLPGIFLFGLILYLTFKGLFQSEAISLKRKDSELADISVAVLASMTGYLVSALFLHGAQIRYFWVLIGVAWAVKKIAELPVSGADFQEVPER
jgi:putative inorganic carbon (hco3(-)) transporter